MWDKTCLSYCANIELVMSNSLNEVEKISPREFARIIKQCGGQVARIKQEKANILNSLKKHYDGVVNPIQKEKELLRINTC